MYLAPCLGSTSDEYPLMVGGFTGIGSNTFATSNNMKFTTVDNENDTWSGGNCTARYASGWWFNSCHGINPNR